MRRKEGGSNGSGGLPVPGRQGPNPGCWNQNREATLLLYLRNNHSRDPEQLLNYTNHSSVKIQPCQFVICSETLKARDTEHQHFKCNLITCTRYYTYLVTRLFFFFFTIFECYLSECNLLISKTPFYNHNVTFYCMSV